DVSWRSAKGTNETWVEHSSELRDVTGNVLRGGSSSLGSLFYFRPPTAPDWVPYSSSLWGTLWPDENAWRLKLEFKRTSGFAPEELVTFKVPVPADGSSNAAPVVKTFGRMELVLTEFTRNTNLVQQGSRWGGLAANPVGQIGLELHNGPAGVVVDYLKMTTDAGDVETQGSSRRAAGSS